MAQNRVLNRDDVEELSVEDGRRLLHSVPDPKLPNPSSVTVPKNMTTQCTAHKRDGDRCPNRAELGSTVCKFHGGGTPLAKNAARRRLLACVGPALDVLNEAMMHADWPHAIKAAQIILDRAGFGPSATLHVEDNRTDDLEEMSVKQLEKRALMVASMLKDKAQEEDERKVAAFEAEILEDGKPEGVH